MSELAHTKEGNYCKHGETDRGYDQWTDQLGNAVCHFSASHM